jgi:hypothetical protein
MHSRDRLTQLDETPRSDDRGQGIPPDHRRARLLLPLLAAVLTCHAAPAPSTYHVLGDDPGAWPKIFRPVGFVPIAGGPATVVVVRRGSPQTAAAWLDRINQGLILVLEGDSDLAQSFGFKPTARRIPVQSLKDARAQSLSIIWEQMLEMPVYEVPVKARVFTAERWEGAPLVAGFHQGKGAVIWVAVNPGAEGYERFPYLLQDLHDLGLEAPFQSRRLWAFFDSSYRLRVDVDYFAKRWRQSGVAALQVAAWHFYDNDPDRAAYLKRLIEACHRESILVYAWFELPHVSDGFWQAHPDWREKTALLEDAQLDWRKLMNLTNRAAFEEAAKGVRALLNAFDWDGVNLAELYFESLEGVSNPARFTPMNDDVRAEYRKLKGVDPLSLMKGGDAKPFLDYRATLARRQQGEWIGVVDTLRRQKPHLDLVVTQIDDRFDTRVRDLLGADATLTLPLLEQHDFTYLIEDPATIWNLGPKRYPEIAAKYKPLTARQSKLAIDINIVDRYQDVYPTKQQTGTELFQLVNTAARAFPRVALYFEKSILNADLAMLASAAAVINTVEEKAGKLIIDSPYGAGIAWTGPALVDGRPWPVRDASTLWISPGRHQIEPATPSQDPPLRIEDFNGTLRSATHAGKSLEFVYESSSRALCRLSKPASAIEVDGEPFSNAAGQIQLVLPRGQHVVTVR